MNILVVSNMYPSEEYPNYGVFVKNFISICLENDINVNTVLLTKQNSKFGKILRYIYYYFRIFHHILFKKNDIVYVHYAGQNSIPIYILSKIKDLNIILNVHGSDIVPEKKMHEYLLFFTKKLVDNCSKIVVPSEYYKKVVAKKFQVKTDNIYISPSAGIDPNTFFSVKKNIARKEINMPLNKKTIGYVGRLDYGKGWDTLLKAIIIMNENKTINPNDYQFVFVGNGKETPQFLDIIKKYQLDKYILHYPLVNQKSLNYFYNSFDVFCFPTRRESESLGLVALEALSCGVPVIASNFAAPSYYIENSFNGYKFEVNSSVELSLQIESFFKLDEEQVKQLSSNAIKSTNKFHKKAISHELINEILGVENDYK